MSSSAPVEGSGTVLINSNHRGEWFASWQANDGEEPFCVDGVDAGTREEAIAWAADQPAGGWKICEPGTSEYVSLK